MREQAVGTRKRVSHFSYLLDDALGRGSFSQVYRGRDDRTGLPVALKVLELAPLPDHAHLDSEIKALAALRHPNIVRLISVCRTAHRCYLVTEYCDGGTLEAWLPLASQLQRLKMCAGLCRGFLGMAEKGILHRDLKPANVLLQGGTARIADFGLSAFGKDIRDQYCVGSPLYMAPESLRSANYSQKSDVWSLGVLVF
jgi:serine/threonine protein kinase